MVITLANAPVVREEVWPATGMMEVVSNLNSSTVIGVKAVPVMVIVSPALPEAVDRVIEQLVAWAGTASHSRLVNIKIHSMTTQVAMMNFIIPSPVCCNFITGSSSLELY
jgi:hypothetical protein